MRRSADLGLIGLGVMGENLALNFESRGYAVSGFDTQESRRHSFDQRSQGKRAWASDSLSELVASLTRPRRLLLMVPAGAAVDAVIDSLRPLLQAGDVIIDGGNTHYQDTERRVEALNSAGLHFVGLGVSGGEQGALHGPALMPGGDSSAWPLIAPMLLSIAARTDEGQVCCHWMGSGGAGHFVKMVHNGIEYADMQAICEAYWLMHQLLHMPAAEIADVFEGWNQGELSSYLVGITADILRRKEPQTGEALVDLIVDTAEQKGTGQWTAQTALELAVPAPTLVQAVMARSLSALKTQRIDAAWLLRGPASLTPPERTRTIETLGQALMAARICTYAQGFALIHRADAQYHWHMQAAQIAATWRAGCIIRARLLADIAQAFDRRADLPQLLLDPELAERMGQAQQALREMVCLGALSGFALPTLAGSLAYYDAYRSERLPANLLQAQRDYFGAHGYRRLDKPGVFHTHWKN